MTNESEICPKCGAPRSSWLEGNCPSCLIRLGAPEPPGKTLCDDPEASLRAGIVCSLGNYELLEEIARGGMGVVYRARQVSLNRLVAVKVLIRSQAAGDAQRFRREAKLAASLSHPNIVAIHEVGEQEGQPYFSMELIEGRSLAELSRDKPMGARRAAELTKTVAEAVQYAHERHLLHRDLKPSNVLVDTLGVPHVTDFGLAKRSDGDADLTLAGQVLGTPNYMPPEQAEAKGGQSHGSVASDVYSLGAILYQLLTGRVPFLAETLTQTLRLVIESDPISPRLLNPDAPRDLVTVCLKCMEKEAARRYTSAQELADELGRFLRDEPIRARPIGVVAKSLRWCRRKPALAVSLLAAGTLLLLVVIGSPIVTWRINAARQRAQEAERQTEQQLYTALFEQARATVRSGEMGHRVKALEAIQRASAIKRTADLGREVFAALALPDLRFERELSLGADANFVQLDPSFARLATSRGEGSVEVRAVSDNRLLATLPASTNFPSFYRVWSADGRFLAVKRDYPDGGRHADWEIWEMAKPGCVLLLRNVSFNALSFHPRLPRVIARTRAEGVTLWNLDDGREVVRFPLAGRSVILGFAPDGGQFASISPQDGGTLLSVHDATDPDSPPLASHVFKDGVSIMAWHPDGSALVVPDHGGGVHWVETRTGGAEVLGRHKSQAVRAVFSPDGAYLFTGGWEQDLICWDTRTKRRAFTASLNSHDIQFNADGRRCAVPTQTSVQLYSFERPAAHREFAEDLGVRLRQATISPDGRWLAASGDKRAGVWDLSGRGPGALDTNAYGAHLYITADGRELFGSRNTQGDTECFRWRLTPSTNSAAPPGLTRLPLGRPSGFTSLSLISNSVVLISTKGSQILAPDEFEANSARWAPTISGINGVSPDGRWLGIYRGFSSSLYVYRLPGLEAAAKLSHPASFGDFQFSPAGDEVAITSSRAGAEFWSTKTWERTRALTNAIRLLYAPDARALWLTKDQRTAGLYDARSLEPLLLLPTGMLPLALSPGGRRVAVSVDAQRLQVWDLVDLRNEFRALGLDWVQDSAAAAR
jgi:eukaryotic-like serine/threonine-protein kinase